MFGTKERLYSIIEAHFAKPWLGGCLVPPDIYTSTLDVGQLAVTSFSYFLLLFPSYHRPFTLKPWVSLLGKDNVVVKYVQSPSGGLGEIRQHRAILQLRTTNIHIHIQR